MRRIVAALVAGTLMILLTVALPSHAYAASGSGCTALQQTTVGCPTNTGTSVVVDGSHTTPGRPSTPTRPNTTPIRDSAPTGPAPSDPRSVEFGQCLNSWDDQIACFLATQPDDPTPDDDADPTPSIPAITITDLAAFAPASAPLTAEPDNAGVAGLPTNFLFAPTTHTTDGTLFGYPVSVRFTPTRTDVHHGDGTITTTTDPGATWDDLGQAPFTPTPTSHTYTQRGEYTAHAVTYYTAEINLGVGWYPIPGELTTTGTPQTITIYEAHTALVAHTCSQTPTAPGC